MSYGLGRKDKRCEGRQFLKRPPWTMWNVLINRSINTHLKRKRRDTCKCGRWEITWYNRHWNSAVSVCVVGITCFPGRTQIDARTLFTILPATTVSSHKAATRPLSCLAHSHSSGLTCRDAAHCPKYCYGPTSPHSPTVGTRARTRQEDLYQLGQATPRGLAKIL